jgi:hypothetical protein
MKELGERFLTQYVPVRCKPSTQAEYRRSVELFLDPFFAKQHARSVTTADVPELHGSLSHIPYQANRTLGVLSKMMSLAETWGIRDKHTNPCEDIERYPERKRERFLSPEHPIKLEAIVPVGGARLTFHVLPGGPEDSRFSIEGDVLHPRTVTQTCAVRCLPNGTPKGPGECVECENDDAIVRLCC